MYSKEEAHSQIAALVERFQEQLPSYKKSDYNETLTCHLIQDQNTLIKKIKTNF